MRCNLDRSLINIYLHGNSFSKENLNRYKIIKREIARTTTKSYTKYDKK